MKFIHFTFYVLALLLISNFSYSSQAESFNLKVLSVIDKSEEKKLPRKIELISNKKFLTTKNCMTDCDSLKKINAQLQTFQYNSIGNPFFTVCEKAGGIVLEGQSGKRIDLGCYFVSAKVYINSHKAFKNLK